LILISGIEWQDERRGRLSPLHEGAKQKQEDKEVTHKQMLKGIGWEGSVLEIREGG
jgi:hypothetical protein